MSSTIVEEYQERGLPLPTDLHIGFASVTLVSCL
jgi:hypothetical protein